MAKVVLFEADGIVYETTPGIRQCRTQPLGLKYMEAALKKAGHEAVVAMQRTTDFYEFARVLSRHGADIYAATASTCEFPATAHIMSKLEAFNPHALKVVGGYHASSYPETILKDKCPQYVNPESIDNLVVGEGEETIVEIADNYSPLFSPAGMKGVVSRAGWGDSGIIVFDGKRKPLDVDKITPFSLTLDEVAENYFDGLAYRKNGNVAAIQTERGCSFGCKFCATQDVYGNSVRPRSIEAIGEEIEWLVRNLGVDMVIDYAATQNRDSKRLHELCAEIRKRGLQKQFSMYGLWRLETPDGRMMVDEDAIRDLADTLLGFKAGIGVEALTEKDAEFIGKRHSVENLMRASEIFDKHSAIFRGFYMITPETTMESIDACKKGSIVHLFDDLRIVYLTPFPGTRLAHETQDMLIDNDWRKFTCETPVLKSNHLTVQQLADAQHIMMGKFLMNPERRRRIKAKVERYPHLMRAYGEYDNRMRALHNGI
jgi:radical SAM superfamily enzyme YgiQ (UPF0313 family)